MNMEENAQNLRKQRFSSKPQSKKEFFELFQKEDQSEDKEEGAGGQLQWSNVGEHVSTAVRAQRHHVCFKSKCFPQTVAILHFPHC